MTKYPRLKVNLEKIKHNAKRISKKASEFNIDIAGVTKATCGDPKVANAMKEGGVNYIADSRIENIKKLRKSEFSKPLILLRTPMLSEIKKVVEFADISLNSEIPVIRELSNQSKKHGFKHKIILMVEMGDLREGINKKEIFGFIEKILKFEGIEIYGIGMNLACFGGVIPTEKKEEEICRITEEIEKKFDINFKMISGGNSANIPLLFKKTSPTKINNYRIGEGILLGLETVNRKPISSTFQDAFILEAEIIELKRKPSVPKGEISQNAFGEKPDFQDKGKIDHGIVAIGRQDVIVEDLTPCDKNIEIIGSSSDHIILDIKKGDYEVGDIVRFNLKYGALVHLYTSKYVGKCYC
ncbi:MAG: alanine/ornithine racemase family PLP-dependent enzyme [Candidatus Thermoplasmatota archaeon]